LQVSNQEYRRSGGLAVLGVGLHPHACWNFGFKYRRGHGCWFLVNVVFCQVETSTTGRLFVQGSSTDCVCVTECDLGHQWPSTSTMSGIKFRLIKLKHINIMN